MARVAQYLSFLLLVTALAPYLGRYLARVFTGGPTVLDRALLPIERVVHRICGIDPTDEMSWRKYFSAFVALGAVNALVLFLILRHQHAFPGGPEARFLTTPMSFDLALNTAVSFVTGTTWQAYAGESTLTYAAQSAGLVTQGFARAWTPADTPNNAYVHPILVGGRAVSTAGGIVVEHADGKVTKVVLDQDSKAYCPTFESLDEAVRSLKQLGVAVDRIVKQDRPATCASQQMQ